MKFIFPRVLALTAIAGLATLVMSLLFKLLIVASAIMMIATIAKRRFMRRGRAMKMGGGLGFQRMEDNPYGNSVHPFRKGWQSGMQLQPAGSGVIPIN